MSSGFRLPNHWDPVFIIAQIVLLQTAGHVTLALTNLVLQSMLLGEAVSLHLLFDPSRMGLTKTYQWGFFLAWAVTIFITSKLFPWIIERTRNCVDFATTFHFVYFIMSWLIYKFPTTLLWWVFIIASTVTMIWYTEKLCTEYEMNPITLSKPAKRPTPSTIV